MEISVIVIIWRNGVASYALMAMVCSRVYMWMMEKENNSLTWSAPDDVIWQQRAWSILAQVMFIYAAKMLTREPCNPLWHNLKIMLDITSKKCIWKIKFLAATKQLYKWFSPYHQRSIMRFSGVISIDKSYVYAKGQGLGSKVKVTKVKAPFSHFQIVTPVWIHIWRWNGAQSLMWHSQIQN